VVVPLILVLSCLFFRGLGFVDVPAFATWQASARDALSLMLVFTGVSHFTFMKEDFVRMMPPSIPRPKAMVYITGACEIAGAAGLLLAEFRRAAAYALIAFFPSRPARQYSRRSRWYNSSRPTRDKPLAAYPDAGSFHRHSLLVRPLRRQSGGAYNLVGSRQKRTPVLVEGTGVLV